MSAFLSDGLVRLRPVMRADLPQLAAWRNDPALRARTREFRPLTDVDQERWFERISGPDRHDFMFVVEVPYGRAIGVVGLCYWDPLNASAEASFYIGDESSRGKGHVTHALQLLHRWGFDDLRLHRVWAECFDVNLGGHAVLRKLGYQQTGTRRDTVWYGTTRAWGSSVMYDLLETEWRAR